MSVHSLHCTHVKSHLTKRVESRPLWPVMIGNSPPTHERRKLVKTYRKNVLPRKETVVTEVRGQTYPKKNDTMK